MTESDWKQVSFDRYARMVKRLLGAPVSTVTIVEEDRQVFAGAVGVPEPWISKRETPLSHSFCQYVVADQAPLVISDARLDPRLADNLAIPDLGVVAYAGWPVTDHTGTVIGSLCAIDSESREWTADDLDTLEDLAAACSAELGERSLRLALSEALDDARASVEHTAALLALSQALSATRTYADIAIATATVTDAELGCRHAGIWLRDVKLLREGDEPLPLPGTVPETLSFVRHPSRRWLAAETHECVPLDGSTPIGAVVVDRSPAFFPNRAERDLRFPEVAVDEEAGGARALIPLTAGGSTFGGLALVWPAEHVFTPHERAMVTALSAYVAQAVLRAALFQERVDVALTLQNAMLTSLPRPDHLALAARYRPAGARDQIGGDWYDAVVTASGATHLMIGDVAGHDIAAAAHMGQLRNTLRTLAWSADAGPAATVVQLDRALDDLGVETIASLVLARIERDDGAGGAEAGGRVLRWTTAGHPPPLLVEASGAARFLTDHGIGGTLLGLGEDLERPEHTLRLRPGDMVVLYTDGLIERRGLNLDVGLGLLRDAAMRHAQPDPDAFLDALLAELSAGRPEDDVAVLAAYVTP